MTNEITEQKTNSLIAVIENAVTNPEVDVNKMQQLLDMQERIMDKQAVIDFNQAMRETQNQMPDAIHKNKYNEQTRSNYSDLEVVSRAIKPVYTKNGFSIKFSEGDARRDNEVRVLAKLSHASGHSETHHVDIPIDDKGIKGSVNKTATHAKASAFSYGRRYLIMMLFDIATSDDDGNSAGGQVLITEAQAKVIERKLGDPEREPAFCDYYGIDRIAELPKSKFDMAVAAIQKKDAKNG